MKTLLLILTLCLSSVARAEIPFVDDDPTWVADFQGIGGKGGVGGKGGIGGGTTSVPPITCSTFTDNFAYTGTLPNPPWTISTAAGYNSIDGASGSAVSNPTSSKALAVYSSATSGGDQCSQFTLSINGGGVTGPGVLMSVAGTGYTWDMSAGVIYYVSGGAGINTPVTGCTAPIAGEVVKITYTLSTGVLATYRNGTLDCSGTDTLNTPPTTGYPSILLDGVNTAITSWGGG